MSNSILELADHDLVSCGYGLEDSIEKTFDKANKYYSKLIKESENTRGNRNKMLIYEDYAGEEAHEYFND